MPISIEHPIVLRPNGWFDPDKVHISSPIKMINNDIYEHIGYESQQYLLLQTPYKSMIITEIQGDPGEDFVFTVILEKDPQIFAQESRVFEYNRVLGWLYTHWVNVDYPEYDNDQIRK